MKFKVFSYIVLTMLVLNIMTSCSADKKSLPPDGYLYCGYCHGTGYDYYYLGGLISEECTSWSGSGYGLNPNSSTGMPVFKGSGHVHVDEELPWKECDICKKHELYW